MMHHHVEEKKDDHDCDYHNIHLTAKSELQTPTTNVNLHTNNRERNRSRPLLLLLCATGITSCYLWYGTIQEHLFQLDKNANKEDDEKQSITLFLLATGTFSSVMLALFWIVIGPLLLPQKTSNNHSRKDEKRDAEAAVDGRLNHPLLALTSITYLCAMAASNESLHYVSYPTCVLAKSSKLIPTMFVGWLVDKYRSNRRIGTHSSHKGINRMEWLGAALITLGIILFQYIQLQKQSNDSNRHGGDTIEQKGDSPYGLALLGLSLFMDGLLGACQSTLKQVHQPSSVSTGKPGFRPPSAMETMLYINLYATLILIPCCYYAGQFQQGVNMMFPSTDTINDEARNISKLLLQLKLSASMGQVFVFLTIHHFSPLICTIITTTRKFFTILLSVYKFGHVLDIWQWTSVGLVFGGLYFEIVAKFIGEKGDGKKHKKD